MPRWLRVVRGMIGTGVTFAAGVGVVASMAGGVVWLMNRITGRELAEIVGKISVAAFLLGVAFAGALAIAARSRRFNKLSLRLASALGAGVGLLYFVLLAMNGGRNWSTPDAISNFVLLAVMGAGSAAAMVLIARRAGAALASGGDVHGLNAGDAEIIYSSGPTQARDGQPVIRDTTDKAPADRSHPKRGG